MKSLSILLALAELATANLYLDRRAPPGCVADNCLRALTVTDSLLKTTRPVLAKSDCAIYQKSTTTITYTPLTATFYSTKTILTSTTSTTYTTGTQTSVVVIPTTIIVELPAKRNVVHPIGSLPPSSVTTIPAYASPCTSVARFLSACSCAGFVGTTITVSTTLATPSTTISRPATSIISIIQISSLIVTTTTTQTSATTTTTQDAAPTQPAGAFCPTTSYAIGSNPSGITGTYSEFYVGTGLTENSNSQASYYGNLPGTSYPFSDGGDDCQALKTCLGLLATKQTIGSIALYLISSQQTWNCIIYSQARNTASDFNVVDSTVGNSYGFSYPVSSCGAKRELEGRC